jgi:glucose dehydrogenase
MARRLQGRQGRDLNQERCIERLNRSNPSEEEGHHDRRDQCETRVWTAKRILITLGVLVVLGAITGVGLVLAFPGPTSFAGGMAINFFKTLGAPAGTLSTESNPPYKAAETTTPSLATVAASGAAVADDWPSYNRTLSSDRYSPLSQINTKNVGKLRILCTYDVREFTSFESGLIMVNNALIGTTEHDTFSVNAATCAENWRTHESAINVAVGGKADMTFCSANVCLTQSGHWTTVQLDIADHISENRPQ